jgi:GNAT superfamily N-acetyltransferase
MDTVVEPLKETELDLADEIFRTAFSTFTGIDKEALWGDSDLFRTRWRARNTRAIGAWVDGRLVGSNIITRWGSFGSFGPLTISPDHWDHGIAKALMAETERILENWKVTHRGLFTFPNSAKHVGLYQRFGYWPQRLTPILGRQVPPGRSPAKLEGSSRLFSELTPKEQAGFLQETRELTSSLYPGLDLSGEVESVQDQHLGETLFLLDGSRLGGFAVCHIGAGSEARTGQTYVKFGAIAPGPDRDQRRKALITNIETMAALHRAPTLELGCNTAHRDTYRYLTAQGYRSDFIGIAMMSPDEPAYQRAGLDVLNDLR